MQPLSTRRGSRRGKRGRSSSRSKRRKCKIKGRRRVGKNGVYLCLREEEAGNVSDVEEEVAHNVGGCRSRHLQAGTEPASMQIQS